MPSAASHPLACRTQADTCLLYESESPSLLQPSVVQELFASIPIYHSDTDVIPNIRPPFSVLPPLFWGLLFPRFDS